MLETILVFMIVGAAAVAAFMALYLLNASSLLALAYIHDSNSSSKRTKMMLTMFYIALMFFGSWGIVKFAKYLSDAGRSLVTGG